VRDARRAVVDGPLVDHRRRPASEPRSPSG
jgi:hypothetical protein